MAIETIRRHDIQPTAEQVRATGEQFHFFLGQGIKIAGDGIEVDVRSLYNSHVSVNIVKDEGDTPDGDLLFLPADQVKSIELGEGRMIRFVAGPLGLNRTMHFDFPQGFRYSLLPPEDDILDREPGA